MKLLQLTFWGWAFLHLVSTVLIKTFTLEVQLHISQRGVCSEEREETQTITIPKYGTINVVALVCPKWMYTETQLGKKALLQL